MRTHSNITTLFASTCTFALPLLAAFNAPVSQGRGSDRREHITA
jgi:hypothetical protein